MVRAALIVIGTAWAIAAQVKIDSSERLAYEASTVKPSDPSSNDSGFHVTPGRLRANGQTLRRLAALAYELDESQVVGGPAWIAVDRYDIVATWPQTGPAINWNDDRTRMKTLLAERFQLVIHREERELRVLVLAVGKGGPKFRASKSTENVAGDARGDTTEARTRLAFTEAPIAKLVSFLRQQLGQLVVDQTDLREKYDLTVEWARSKPGGEPVDPDSKFPSLFTAIQEQLGLKLVPAKAPVEVIVIDRAMR